MHYPSIFDHNTTELLVSRINALQKNTKPQWGSMTSAQMLAHCCVPYHDILGKKEYSVPKIMTRLSFITSVLFKKYMLSDKPFTKHMKTGKDWIINDERNFEVEKQELLFCIHSIEKMGEKEFDGKSHKLLGKLKYGEWSILLYKHLDHHLRQFGV